MFLALLLAAAPAPQAAPLQPAGAGADARCIVVFGALGSRGGPEQAASAKQGIFYFLGKIRGRDPRADVAAVVTRGAAQARASGANAQAEAQRCLAEVRASGAALAAGASRSAPRPSPRRP